MTADTVDSPLAGDAWWSVDVTGRVADPRTLDARTAATMPTGSLATAFRCSSGERWRGEWVGVPVSAVLERVDAAPDATHLRIRSRDGHAACLAVDAALAGVLAVERRDEQLAPTSVPRFVARDAAGARSVKATAELELLRLGPAEDPTDYETLRRD